VLREPRPGTFFIVRMTAKTQTAERLSELLATTGPLEERRTLAILRQITGQIAELHAAGEIHRLIRAECVVVEGDTAKLAASDSDGEMELDGTLLPPELGNLDLPQLPKRIEDARAALLAAGSDLDPRRIDIYQLGCLACEMLTGRSPQTYLFSPRAKARLVEPWRRVLDGMLGYDPSLRFTLCADLEPEFERIAGNEPQPASPETPPRGTGIDALTNTPRTPHPAATSLPFTKLDHYHIVARLGSGGMGDVYRGYDSQLERTVALKVLPPELARQADFVRRFTDEAKGAARIVHPNIVQIYSIGEDAGHHYFAMQYVAGETLAARLSRKTRLSLDGALEIIEQVLSGLSVAHRQGMIHRDIKPGNILLDAEHGRALLADFGLVKSLDSSEQMTATGMVMGTVDYISPEQGRGQKVDTRSDLYSVGVLLYQMLSGQLPFVAESATAMIFQHAYEKPRPLEDVVPDIAAGANTIVRRLLAKNPADRYQTADDLLTDVRALHAAHDWQPASSLGGVSDKSILIATLDSDFSDDDRRLTVALAPLPRPCWQDRLRVLFHLHAPALIKNLQNTEQQVDGALAIYQARRDNLAGLAHEAAAVERQLAEQGLITELHQQQSAREEIQLRLAKADATLQKLRSQQAILRARLRAVEADKIIAGTDAHRPAFQSRFVMTALLGLAFLVFIVLIYFLRSGFSIAGVNRGIDIATIESPSPDAILPSAGWVNLAPYVDLSKDTAGGIWSMVGDTIHVANQPGTIPAKTKYLQIPLVIRGSYEFRFKYKVGKNRSRGLSVRLPMGQARGALLIGQSRRDSGLGINGIKGLPSNDPANPTGNANFANPTDVERDAFIHVDLGPAGAVHVTVAIDGHKQIDWSGNEADVNIRDSETGKTLPKDPLLILGGWGMGITFRQPALRMLDGSAEPWRAPNSAPQVGALKSSENVRASAPVSKAPVLPAAIPGRLSVVCKGEFELFLNGTRVFAGSGKPFSGTSAPITLRDNDIIAIRVKSNFVNRAIRVAFTSQDGHWVWAAARQNFRVVKDSDSTSIMAAAFNQPGQIPDSGTVDPTSQSEWDSLIAEDDSEWMWAGDRDAVSQFATIVHPSSFDYNAAVHNVFDVLSSGEWEWSKPINAGPTINTDKADECPFLSVDGLTLLFDSDRPGGSGGHDIWMTQRPRLDAQWGEPINLGPTINSAADEYHPSMTADGLTLVFGSTRSGGVGDGDIYMATRPTTTAPWGQAVNLERPVNSNLYDGGAWISPDGRTLIFSSDRQGGVGHKDLWVSHRKSAADHWGRVANVGSQVNTAHGESGPFRSSDGLVLLFQSNRLGGFGKWDLWMATRPILTQSFGKPVNLGGAINGGHSDETPSLSADGQTLWFSSDRTGGLGAQDIWYSQRVKRAANTAATTTTTINTASPTTLAPLSVTGASQPPPPESAELNSTSDEEE
jgi:serine/threonine protein kinase/Tol biopolymer transport system component